MTRMGKIAILFVALASIAGVMRLAARGSERGTGDAGKGSGFSEYRIVLDNNIFDPNRRRNEPRKISTPAPRKDVRPTPPPRTASSERFDLTGALIYEKGAVAFFEGSKAEYTVALKPGRTIGGFLITDVRTNAVVLEKKGRRIELKVGSGLSRSGSAAWELADAASSSERESYSAPAASGGGTDGGATAKPDGSSSGGGGGMSLLQRLIEKRKKELGG